jgi:hypothetical protein
MMLRGTNAALRPHGRPKWQGGRHQRNLLDERRAAAAHNAHQNLVQSNVLPRLAEESLSS